MFALRKAIDKIKETGASEEDAVRLITARAENPDAFSAFFTPPAAPVYGPPEPPVQGPPDPGIQGPPTPVDFQPPPIMPPMPKNPQMLFANTAPKQTVEQARFGQGIADQTYPYGYQRPGPYDLGPEGVEVYNRTVQFFPGLNDAGVPNRGYYDGTVAATDTPKTMEHEIGHAYQAQYLSPVKMNAFVEKVYELANKGNPGALRALSGYFPGAPAMPGEIPGAYGGASDPQHLFTWFIDNPSMLPDELAPFYAGLFTDQAEAERDKYQDRMLDTALQAKSEEARKLKRVEMKTRVVEILKGFDSYEAAIEGSTRASDILTLVRAVGNNEVYETIRWLVPDEATLVKLRLMRLDDAEDDEIFRALIDAGYTIGYVDE